MVDRLLEVKKNKPIYCSHSYPHVFPAIEQPSFSFFQKYQRIQMSRVNSLDSTFQQARISLITLIITLDPPNVSKYLWGERFASFESNNSYCSFYVLLRVLIT